MRRLILAAIAATVACHSSTSPSFTGTCRVWQATPQSIPDNKLTILSYDGGNCSFARGDRLVLPAGTWALQAQITWAPSNVGQRGICLWVNDLVASEGGARPMLGNVGTVVTSVANVVSDGNTEIYVSGTQTSGAPLSTMTGKDAVNRLTFINVTRVN